jgi:putative peptidoglycan lipid II flippase
LPMYSAFLVFTRAYYAVGDARTPTFVNALTIAISSVVGAVLFASLPSEWAVPGLALGHSVGFAVGGLVLTRLFYKRVGAAGSTKLTATLIRAAGVSVVAFGLMSAVRLITPEGTRLEWAVSLILTTIAGVGAYVAMMAALRAPELERLQRVVTGLGRRRR